MLLACVVIGLAIGQRLLRGSRETELGVRESERVGTPVTLGILRPMIVLPADWREWGPVKLQAVLAHERAHIRRYDPAVQLLSAMHRALSWMSPLSWFLNRQIVRTAEQASDDAAVAALGGRASYAETLLEFMQRGMWGSRLAGVPMARYGSPDGRIDRILDRTALSRGVTRRSLAAILALGSPLAYVVATAQARPAFEVADVHAIPYANRRMQGGALNAGRYQLRSATMVDLIKTAYGVEADTVIGGPSWLDYDRYDVIAKAAPDTPPVTSKLMLQTLLADRFNLVVHKDTKLMPAFALTVGKGKPKLKNAEGSGDTGCQAAPQNREPGAPLENFVSCRNMTMAAFAQNLGQIAGGGYLPSPVVDLTGLTGTWNFDLRRTLGMGGGVPFPVASPASIFDAVDKQLGLSWNLTKFRNLS